MFVSSVLLLDVSMSKPIWTVNIQQWYVVHCCCYQAALLHMYTVSHCVQNSERSMFLQSGNVPQPIISGHCGIKAFWHSCSFDAANLSPMCNYLLHPPRVTLLSGWASSYVLDLIFIFEIIWEYTFIQPNHTIHESCCSNIKHSSLLFAPVHAGKKLHHSSLMTATYTDNMLSIRNNDAGSDKRSIVIVVKYTFTVWLKGNAELRTAVIGAQIHSIRYWLYFFNHLTTSCLFKNV